MAANKQVRTELQNAAQFLKNMETATDFVAFEVGWRNFLVSIANVWKKLKAAYKSHQAFNAWWTTFAPKCKDDPLLRYLTIARGSHEHSVADLVQLVPGRMTAGLNSADPSRPMTIRRLDMRGPQPIIDGDNIRVTVQVTPARGALLRVTNDQDKKNPISCEPPTEHLGQHLADNDALTIARLALTFYRAAVAEAEAKFT